MEAPIRVVARITVKPGKEDQVKSALSSLVEPTRQESGCLHYELLQNSSDSAEFVLLEEWETQAALDSHSAASHTKTVEAAVENFLKQVPPDVRLYQTIA